MTATDKTLAKDMVRLKKASSYKEFKPGFFRNVPELGGHIYRFKCAEYSKIFLIVNTTGGYSKEYFNKEEYHFIIRQAGSLKEWLTKFFQEASDVMDMVNNIMDKDQQNADIRAAGVPHGYKVDPSGEVVIDPKEALLVKRIYKLYTNYGSIRKIAAELKTNYSHVRDVLHDYRYERMEKPIIPSSNLKKVRQMMDTNRKNRTT